MPSQHLVRASGSGGWHGRCGSVQLSIPPWPRGRAWRTKQEREDREEGVRQTRGHLLSCCPWGEKTSEDLLGQEARSAQDPTGSLHTQPGSVGRGRAMQERKTAWYPMPRLLAMAHGWQASISATCLLSSTLAWSSVNYLHLLLQCRNPVPCLMSNAGDGAWPVTVGP